jgi:hypothetical protein
MASSSSSLLLLAAALLALVASWQQAIAYDPSPLQDFCVADKNSPGTHDYICMHAGCLFRSSQIDDAKNVCVCNIYIYIEATMYRSRSEIVSSIDIFFEMNSIGDLPLN